MTLGSQADEASAARMVDQCLDAGINFFDTANMYNKGKSEEMLGQILAGRRQRLVDVGLSRAAMRKAAEASLRRLRTDYLDVYYLHQPDYDVPIEETLEAMNELVRAGKVRYPAVSNYAAWQVSEILSISEKNGFKPPYISQPMYNLLARGIEEEYLPFAKRFGVAVVPYNPLAGGLLTGKHSLDKAPPPGSRFDGSPLYRGRYWHEDYFAAVEDLRGMARDAGKTLVELSLQWL
ncbi:MAG: aldo/keto reductase, partial [Acidobacteria bacterium]